MLDADVFRPALAKIVRLKEGSIRELIGRVPEPWMPASAREFAGALTRYTRKE